MATRWCSSCGQAFVPAPQVPRQMYCALPDCQRERRRLWQIAKRRSDPDYLANQAHAQKAWSERNPEYWRTYRDTNPNYASGNRAQQRARNRKRVIAKMDSSPPPLPAGIYELRLLQAAPGIAKKDVWVVSLRVLPSSGP
ncbi:hypothetical protein [Variovorax sp. RA8]|uniref:hypothetical protein n=1 Tax=Variovorax sp. (strain JCM 16519 / RA8) TaxID=662548 RepID=UPI000AE05B15|nr:hypothetical protein [Variovorax sp. RA8]VTU43152.1 hypothetical protein RA8P1_00412 [Variovorax sp. RA8]